MKFAIAGAGAIGAYVGAQFARAGEEVALIARGPHLHAIRQSGLTIRSDSGEYTVHPFATENPVDIGPVDAVLLSVKAQSLPQIVPRLGPLLGAETPVLTGQNGIPWWYFQKHGGALEGTRLETVDPGGLIARTVPVERIIGWVIYCSAVIVEPGVVRQVEGNRFSIGELDGARSDRCAGISQAFHKAGMRCPVRSRIRHDIWVKLIGNLSLNPVSALTGTTLDRMLNDPGVNSLIRAIMEEGAAVAAAVGVPLEISIDERMAGAAKVGAHKTSMLQDLEAGKSLELDCIAGAVVELAGRLGIATPCTRAVYACTRLLAKNLGLL